MAEVTERQAGDPWPECASCAGRALFILNGVLLCGECLLSETWVSDLFTLVGNDG